MLATASNAISMYDVCAFILGGGPQCRYLCIYLARQGKLHLPRALARGAPAGR